MESETENENTNPPGQDGDSNFVSNDSTSQEPIMDENTTQTTVTTTTEEEVEEKFNTSPLASDSESNIEPPPPPRHTKIAYANNNSNSNHKTPKEATTNNIANKTKRDSSGNSKGSALTANGNGLLPAGLESRSEEAVVATVLDNSSSNISNASNSLRESEYEDESSSNSNNINGNSITLNTSVHLSPPTPSPLLNNQCSTDASSINEANVSPRPVSSMKRSLNSSRDELAEGVDGLSAEKGVTVDVKEPEVKRARNSGE